MNSILNLKGNLEYRDSKTKPGFANIPKNQHVTLEHLMSLKKQLIEVSLFWKNESLNIPPLITVYYTEIVAKSNRIKGILENDIKKNNNSVVGVKYSQDKKHVITHCISHDVLIEAIRNIENVIEIVKMNFNNTITNSDLHVINSNKNFPNNVKISKTRFVNTIVDAYYLERFGIEQCSIEMTDSAIISLYNTGVKTNDIMKQLDIDFIDDRRKLDETTVLLNPIQYKLLKEKAPYLIAMAVSDISVLEKCDVSMVEEPDFLIPLPNSEPTIGVIDTLFNDKVYFSKWVEFENKIGYTSNDIDDYKHGTMVSSIIVDGASINPSLDDGCGRFKVKHFGVATSKKFSSFTVIKTIKEIVEANRDIKVWNLSLGSPMEISDNFISPEAAILDKIQYENDVIFVIAGTNKPVNSDIKKIGSPADSINSLVVNSVDFDGKPAEYSREGLVLSFFNKPDVCYYGGSEKKKIRAVSPFGVVSVSGTSFAAPWIARKLAYLIEILGFTRELAKAILIDSATGWNDSIYSPKLIGFGVVPIKIEEIVKTPDDEIKFMIQGTCEKFDTYNYNIPVPEDKGKQPFVAKATLCYFPKCFRNQGVDYTNSELDIHFGRLKKDKKSNITIKTINDNDQSEPIKLLLPESTARKLYRKWDNVKHIRENIQTLKGNNKKPKTKRESGLWGLSIKTKKRIEDCNNLKFGLVITLKAIDGINRIQDFIQQCQLRGWLVERINIEKRIEIYNKAEEIIYLD